MNRIRVGWLKWRTTQGVLFGTPRLKEKLYRRVIKPVMLYDSECWVKIWMQWKWESLDRWVIEMKIWIESNKNENILGRTNKR